MLILLSAGAFLAIYLLILGWRAATPATGRREALIGAWLAWGALLVFAMEALSWGRAVRQGNQAVWWFLVCLVVLSFGWRRGALARGWERARAPMGRLPFIERVILAGIILLMGAVLLVALVSPTNNVDSLNHHMVRVVHWAQQGSLEPYPTNRNGQISKPPFAEMMILNTRLLVGDDQLANLVQWTSMASGLVIVSLLASRLGAARPHQLLAVTFAFSVPLGVLLASNTKNDHVVTLWVLCLAFFALASARRPLPPAEVAGAGLALGLGVLTKGTFQVFAFPFLVWLAVNLVKRTGWKRAILEILSVLAIAGLLNLPFWARNIRTFGGPFGSPLGMARALEVDELGGFFPPRDEGGHAPAAQLEESGGLARRIPRRFAALLILNTIFPEIGAPVRQLLGDSPALASEGFLESLDEGLWNHEDSSGNLLHLVVLVIAVLALTVVATRRRDGVLAAYILAVLAGYAALTLVSAATDIWGLRYQFTFFVVGAPLVGVAARLLSKPALTHVLTLLFLAAAVPYAAFNNTRPLVASPPQTRSESVLRTPAAVILTNASPRLGSSYAEAAAAVRESACRQVGLLLQRGDLEYVLWWLLSAPQSGVRLETMAPSPETAGFEDPEFVPCAVVCTTCGELAMVGSVPLFLDLGYVRVYLSDNAGPPR